MDKPRQTDLDKVGIVTVTYNSEKVIDAFMASLMVQTHNYFQLFLVDNASEDQTLMELDRWRDDPRVNVIVNATNLGVAEGNNQGILEALAGHCAAILLIELSVNLADQ